MKIAPRDFAGKGLAYTLRSAQEEDASELVAVRLQIDGETENMDRERGEGFLDEAAFRELIRADSESERNLFLVAVANGRIVAFSRCQGSSLKRLAHRVEFGVGVLQEYWGYGIGKQLLQEAIAWADEHGVKKMTLQVLETNEKAIELYQRLGFETEGVLKQDKLLSDGNYYSTIVMGRFAK